MIVWQDALLHLMIQMREASRTVLGECMTEFYFHDQLSFRLVQAGSRSGTRLSLLSSAKNTLGEGY